ASGQRSDVSSRDGSERPSGPARLSVNAGMTEIQTALSSGSSSLEQQKLVTMLRTMELIRAFDSMLPVLYTKGLLRGSSHAAIGQEAVAVGACSTLLPGDYITSTHRGHGHVIARGADVKRMMAELLGRQDGYCRGKGG